jgi:hypothetical protein
MQIVYVAIFLTPISMPEQFVRVRTVFHLSFPAVGTAVAEPSEDKRRPCGSEVRSGSHRMITTTRELLAAAARIECVAQAVAEQVERERRGDQEKAGEDHEPPGDLEDAGGVRDHAAPRRNALGNSEAEE